MDVTIVKQILYIYSKEEEDSTKSFYSMVNNDLRSANFEILSKYFEIISFINNLIEKEEISTYSGEVYRGTYLTPELINELKPFKKMVNSSFWSSSKDYEEALDFLLKSNINNTLICIKSQKSNIDIDNEELSEFLEEQEVLFIPYTLFEITKVEMKTIENKMVYVVHLIDLNEKNKCCTENMPVINVD